MVQTIINKIKSIFSPFIDFTTSVNKNSLGQLEHMSYSINTSSVNPPWAALPTSVTAALPAWKPAKTVDSVDPLKPIQIFEDGEVFRIKRYGEFISYLWINFKENEYWREYDDDTILVKAEAMAMLRLKFTKDNFISPEKCLKL